MLHTTLTVEVQLDSSSAAVELEGPTALGVTNPPVARAEHHDQGGRGC
jgi:hypothetical protein